MKNDAIQERGYITILQNLCTFSVVMLHANRFWTFSYDWWWPLANVVESVFYFAVPVFFMISGVNLIDYRERYSTKVYFIKRIRKTVIPFLIWSSIGLVGSFVLGSGLDGDYSLANIINQVLDCSVIDVFWFFIPLFSVYLCIPALSLIPKESRKDIFKFLLLVAFAVNIFLPFLGGLFGISTPIEVPLVGGYLYFVLLGYYLDRYSISAKLRKAIFLCGLLGLATHIVGTWALSYWIGSIDMTFKGYLNLPSVLWSTAVFVFFRMKKETLSTNQPTNQPTQSALSRASFGVYLTHWFVLQVFHRCFDIPVQQNVLWLLVGIVVYFGCSALVLIMQKVPLIRMIVP